MSYWATGFSATGDPVTPSAFIHETDKRIVEWGTITLGFNPETFAESQKMIAQWGDVGEAAQ